MTTFDERERAFENKFMADEELRFKVAARRDRLLGLWAAAQLGKTGADADAYASELVSVDVEKPGDDEVVEKVGQDLRAAGRQVADHTVRARMREFFDTAKHQIMTEVR
ncbi:MAG TPA: DUF1476 domain-containing protein [Vineibacter sp.]|nr:DUF1476 domain-containing protein [Vineibacter sp.]